MTKLILVRHGQSAANERKIFAGHLNVPLTEIGQEQARLLADFLDTYSIDALYSSDLQRARDTVLPYAQRHQLSIITNQHFREIQAGLWEGLPFDVLQCRFKQSYAVWLQNIGCAQPNGGETVAALQKRIVSAILSVLRENAGKTVCIATHATPIRVFECFVKNIPLQQVCKVPWVPNASVTVYDYDGNFKEVLRGEASFLQNVRSEMPPNV